MPETECAQIAAAGTASVPDALCKAETVSHSISHRAVSRRTPVLATLVLSAVSVLAGCSSEDGSFATETTKAETSPESNVTVDFSTYCELVAALEGERPEAYVGSAEHQADTEGLIEVAPEAVMEPLQTFAAFLSSGAIVPDDPESNVVENWPPEVQTAIGEIAAFNDSTC